MKKVMCLLILVLMVSGAFAQNSQLFPVQVKEKLPAMTFTQSDGKTVQVGGPSGSNHLVIFIRGKVTPTVWCPICQYQYMEMIEALEKSKIDEKAGLKVSFVMPYKIDSLDNWKNAFPRSLATIDRWKNPQGDVTPAAESWAVYCREFFPGTYTVDPAKLELSLPVLFDQDRSVSNALQIFREEWGGTQVEQNVPTILLLDKEGRVQFKYFSQYTNDRPDADYLLDMVKTRLLK